MTSETNVDDQTLRTVFPLDRWPLLEQWQVYHLVKRRAQGRRVTGGEDGVRSPERCGRGRCPHST